jgi:hypothetical protein
MPTEMHIRPDCRPILAANHLDSFEALADIGLGEPLDKPGLASWRRRSRVMLQGLQGERIVYYLKRYDRPPLPRWRRLVAGRDNTAGPAAYEVAQMEALEGAGIPALRWAAWGREWDGQQELRSFVLTDAVAGEALERWLPERYARMSARQRTLLKPAVSGQLAELVKRFHRAGFVHRDLYASHIFIEVTAGNRVALHLIDLQRVFKPRHSRGRWQVKDLAELNYSIPTHLASRTDRLRWLRAYLGTKRLREEDKRLARKVAAKTDRIARHDAKRARRAAS